MIKTNLLLTSANNVLSGPHTIDSKNKQLWAYCVRVACKLGFFCGKGTAPGQCSNRFDANQVYVPGYQV